MVSPATILLRREVARVRRRARAVLLAGAVLAAAAADIWYEILTFWVQRLLRYGIYFPLFFLVAFAVFAVRVLLRTRTVPLCASLDRSAGLKERLSAAHLYSRLPGLDAGLREAQARETLRSVDFSRLRARFRLRPWASIALIAAGFGGILWLTDRYPEAFRPRNLAFRQGRVVFVTVKNLGQTRRSPISEPGGGQGEAGPKESDHPTVIPIPESPTSPADNPPAGSEATPVAETPPPAATREEGKPHNAQEPSQPREGSPDQPRTQTEPPGQGRIKVPGPDEGGALGRPSPVEETAGITPPTSRPDLSLAPRADDLRGAGALLPPMPFFRILGGRGADEALFDPETMNIILAAYPPKYRQHLEAYLKALQTLKEERRGS